MRAVTCLLVLLVASCTGVKPTPPSVNLISPERLLANASVSSPGQELAYNGSDNSFSYFTLSLAENSNLHVKLPRNQLVIHSGLELQSKDWQFSRIIRLESREQLHLWAVRDPLRKPNSLDRFLDESLPAAIHGAIPEAKDADAKINSKH